MIVPGDIAPRKDTPAELYVAVLSNTAHLRAATGRVITCPFVPGELPEGTMALVVPIGRPAGVLLPELVQWLPSSALDEAIGNVGAVALHEATVIIGALVGQS
ncbi:MAG: toxin [Mycobacterium sp.]